MTDNNNVFMLVVSTILFLGISIFLIFELIRKNKALKECKGKKEGYINSVSSGCKPCKARLRARGVPVVESYAYSRLAGACGAGCGANTAVDVSPNTYAQLGGGQCGGSPAVSIEGYADADSKYLPVNDWGKSDHTPAVYPVYNETPEDPDSPCDCNADQYPIDRLGNCACRLSADLSDPTRSSYPITLPCPFEPDELPHQVCPKCNEVFKTRLA